MTPAARTPRFRVFAALASIMWLLAIALPSCLFGQPTIDTSHPHLASTAVAAAALTTAPLDVDVHAHINDPVRHEDIDSIVALMPRVDTQMFALLFAATVAILAAPQLALLGRWLRGPPIPSTCGSGRETLIQFGIARI